MKRLLVPALRAAALATGVSAYKSRALRVGRILCLHSVGDATYPLAMFAAHLDYLAHHFSIISLAALLDRLDARRELTNELVLTFDDGLCNHLTTVYPLLEAARIPATFFVCPTLIEAGRWVWTHEARTRLARLTPGQRRELSAGQTASTESFVEWMKTLAAADRLAVECQVRRQTTAWTPTPAERGRYDVMTWQDLRRLDPALITIGSHSLTHPILSTLTPGELAAEVVESRRRLESQLQRSVEFFSYPNGSHSPDVVQLAARTNRASCATTPGFVRPDSPRHLLPRIGIAPTLPYLAWRLHRPRS